MQETDLGKNYAPGEEPRSKTPAAEKQERTGKRGRRKKRPAAKPAPGDATGINPEKRAPVDPKSVYLPPA